MGMGLDTNLTSNGRSYFLAQETDGDAQFGSSVGQFLVIHKVFAESDVAENGLF